MDAGTTTGYMLDFLESINVTFVINAVTHARRLAAMGMHVILVGGTLKTSMEAVTGISAVLMLQNYHFSIGFFGTNGVSRTAGFTIPDADEALVKKTALEQCKKAYILCDNSKFNVVSVVTFAPVAGGTILTDERMDELKDVADIVLCG